ncbi:hypothetical protein Tco_1123779 [Tanacetum coccineum]|uniref:Uncharacterized protein n=1 Tax=Tanacetum coccineum TaxID=301880 RepID=A0ABQ5J857_9ASTR
MEVKLMTKKRKVVVSDSDQEEGGEQDVDLDALLALANAAVIIDSNIPPGGASSSRIPTDVPTGVAPTGVSNKGKTPMVEEEDITVKERTLKQMEDDRLGEEAVKRQLPSQDGCFDSRGRTSSVPERMANGKDGRPMTTGEFEKNQKALSNTQVQAFSRTLKRTGPELEEPSSKQQKSTESTIPSVPDVPQPPVVSSPKSSGTRRKSLGRNRLTKPKSILKELDLDADDKTFIKVVSDEDSIDEAPILWSALAGWEVISTPLGEINALYRSDQSTKHFTTSTGDPFIWWIRTGILKLYGMVVTYYENHLVAGAGLMLWGDLQVLIDSQEGEVLYMFADVSYPLSVKLMERMLKHKLEIDKDVVGNDMTTAEQLI